MRSDECGIRFAFDERRAAQAAARILRRHGAPMPGAKLAQLLYLADRWFLVEHHATITGDDFVSTSDGPGLRRIRELASSSAPAPHADWPRYVGIAGDALACATGNDDEGQLSESSSDFLDRIHDRFAADPPQEIEERLRSLSEWRGVCDEDSPIDPREILQAAGYADWYIDRIQADLEAAYRAHGTYVA